METRDVDWIRVVEDVLAALVNRTFRVTDGEGTREYRLWVLGRPSDDPSVEFGPDRLLSGDHAEGYVRQQLSSAHAVEARYERACRTLISLGSSPEAVRAFVGEESTEVPVPRTPEGVEAFSEYLKAWIARQLLSGDEAMVRRLEPDIEAARVRILLSEFRGRFGKALDRLRRLAPIDVVDPLVEEAGRVYLAGHYRSTVLLAWTAVEAVLRKKLGYNEVRYVGIKELLDEARSVRILVGDHIEMARTLRDARNTVAHAGAPVSTVEAEKALDLSRKLVEELSR
ncbi:MAG: hypothetical protein ABS36_12250 [Acidobacteria bacterium SCN 69-37]|nr:MAG: hypothetical protein ABS36_12250 [Acidobacteria bacterium SCN 69-37]